MSTTLTTGVRNGGRACCSPPPSCSSRGTPSPSSLGPGDLATELGVAVPLVAAAVLLVIGTATAAAASPVRPLAIGAVVAAVGCGLGVTGLVTASMLTELGRWTSRAVCLRSAAVAGARDDADGAGGCAAAQDRAQLRRERACQDPRCRPGGRGAARPAGGSSGC